MASKKSPCKKGMRMHKKSGSCKKPCQKNQYRSKKKPYKCITPKTRKTIGPRMKKCPKGSRRTKSGSCGLYY